jgi:hypothetical protein
MANQKFAPGDVVEWTITRFGVPTTYVGTVKASGRANTIVMINGTLEAVKSSVLKLA